MCVCLHFHTIHQIVIIFVPDVCLFPCLHLVWVKTADLAASCETKNFGTNDVV